MAFCDHCQGQRFDRARVLRVLRRMRAELRRTGASRSGQAVLGEALATIRALDIPHLDVDEPENEVVH